MNSKHFRREAHQKVGFYSLAQLELCSIADHLVLAHKCEAVADGGGLPQPRGPPDSILLQRSELAFYHWYQTVQIRLHIKATLCWMGREGRVEEGMGVVSAYEGYSQNTI